MVTEKVTKIDVLNIQPNETKEFVCKDALTARNGQALVLNYVDKFFRPDSIQGYKTTRDDNVLIVTAIAKA